MRIKEGGIFLPLAGGLLTGSPRLSNEVHLIGLTGASLLRNLIGRDSGDRTVLGEADMPMRFINNGVIEEFDGASAFGILTARNTVFRIKTAIQTINNNNTFQNDNDLSFSVLANETWLYWLFFRFNTAVTPDIKTQISLPAGATARGHWWAEATDALPDRDLAAARAHVGDGSDRLTQFNGAIIVGGTAGTIQLQWAQNLLEVSDTSVLDGSYLLAIRVP